ncbi:MAG: hypothetical protein LBP20_09035 [Treponema sp.]|nr:hypothetical protein [Treponema sp.]
MTMLLCVCFAAALCAQSRDDVRVYIAPVSGGRPEQQTFFAENFKMELTGANYTVVDTPANSDYMISLFIVQNVEDGHEDEDGRMRAERIINMLTISLRATANAREILQFSWAFETLEEMYEWNLHLIYQAMANIPLTKLTSVPDTNHWRNKWVYLRGSFDYPITFYAVNEEKNSYISSEDPQSTKDYARLDHYIRPFPGATLGLEFQFLSWMSLEGDFQISFGDPFSTAFIPAIQAALKFPIKPARHFMIEPYGVMSFPAATTAEIKQFPPFGIGGGIQLGVKGGEMGAFFVDVSYIQFLGDVVTSNNLDPSKPYPLELYWRRFAIGLGIGYKIGFVNRKGNSPSESGITPAGN